LTDKDLNVLFLQSGAEVTNKYKIQFVHIYRPLLIIFSVVFFYAFTRYVVFKGVHPIHIPGYIFNKALAVSAIWLVCFSYIAGPLARAWPEKFEKLLKARKYHGVMGFMLGAGHGFTSSILLNPTYFGKFFLETGKMSFVGELSVFFGSLALMHLCLITVTSIPIIENSMDRIQWKHIQRSGMFAALLIFGHVFTMGHKGWPLPSTWPGYMPPLTMIGAIPVVLLFVLRPLISFYGKRIRKTELYCLRQEKLKELGEEDGLNEVFQDQHSA